MSSDVYDMYVVQTFTMLFHISSTGADDTIRKLKALKMSNLVSLLFSDGDAVRVAKDDLCRNSFFQNLFNEQPNLTKYRFDGSEKTLRAFEIIKRRSTG